MIEDFIKYRVYLKNKTTIDCVNLVEKDDRYILSLPGETRNLSFDKVDMIGCIGHWELGCTIDSMALGLEPHKQKAMLRYIKKQFEVSE